MKKGLTLPPQINGIVHRCYLCDALTSDKPLPCGVHVCAPCFDREFPIITTGRAEVTINGKPFPVTKVVVTSGGSPVLHYSREP